METVAMKYCFAVSFTSDRPNLVFDVLMTKIPAKKPTVAEIKNVVKHAMKTASIEDTPAKIVCVEEIDGRSKDRITIEKDKESLAKWTMLQ